MEKKYFWFKGDLIMPGCPMKDGYCSGRACAAYFERHDGSWRCLMIPGFDEHEAEQNSDFDGTEVRRIEFNDPVDSAYEEIYLSSFCDDQFYRNVYDGFILELIETVRTKAPGRLAKKMLDTIASYGMEGTLADDAIERIRRGQGNSDDVLMLEPLLMASMQIDQGIIKRPVRKQV